MGLVFSGFYDDYKKKKNGFNVIDFTDKKKSFTSSWFVRFVWYRYRLDKIL